ncbi:uncharacterized protein EV154DRAFT_551213 [Mucor mucedo]|uniref:uncharacterized protein n=1 Tax=Mucor mucedo TaxID=29922 RepID=UPI0022212988|nr:uncharacterized protein EV154DRAFT_551213 [Mucor mucedo]KAI7891895.1 hypothetical protein EV154DRAFT_551213 [Mucor mucedo]
MQIIWYIHTVRFLAFFISLITFVCHLAQCILLSSYQEQTGISDWITAGHWQYLLWFISLGLSLAGSFTLCLNAYYYNRPKRYLLDKCIGLLALLLLLTSIIIIVSMDSSEPWTNNNSSPIERSSLMSSCSLFDSSRDKFYPLLYQRCMLSDSIWILSILLCIVWTSVVLFAMMGLSQKKKETAKNPIQPAQEPNWGRYIPHPPASIYSATTLGNRSGLLTPSFVKQYSYNNRSMPSTIQQYKEEKEEYFDDDEDEDDESYSARDYYHYSPPSISSSTRYTLPTKLTLDFELEYTTPTTPSPSDPDTNGSMTPLYHSFASKSKKY